MDSVEALTLQTQTVPEAELLECRGRHVDIDPVLTLPCSTQNHAIGKGADQVILSSRKHGTTCKQLKT